MSEARDLRYRADELVWYALNTGDLSVTAELRKINDSLEIIHRKRVGEPPGRLVPPIEIDARPGGPPV